MIGKEYIEEKISFLETQFKVAVNDFLRSNKRVDRDRVIILKSKLEIYREVVGMLN